MTGGDGGGGGFYGTLSLQLVGQRRAEGGGSARCAQMWRFLGLDCLKEPFGSAGAGWLLFLFFAALWPEAPVGMQGEPLSQLDGSTSRPTGVWWHFGFTFLSNSSRLAYSQQGY